jgi:hypothetical protein
VEPVQETPSVPSAMVVVDRLPRREVAWELTPLAPRSDNVKHGVNDKAGGPVTPATANELGKMPSDQGPLRVRQAAGISWFHAGRNARAHTIPVQLLSVQPPSPNRLSAAR